MALSTIILLHILMAMGSYCQVTAGFAFGLIVMAGIGLFDILPLEEGAILVMLLGLINTTMALKGQNLSPRQIKTVPFIWFSPIGVVIGLYLLYWMINYPTWYNVLYMMLGAFIMFAGLSVMIKPSKGRKKSPMGVFYFFHILGGICGGLFCTAGPPIIYILYRQPWCMRMLRRMTLTIFGLGLATRTVFTTFHGGYTMDLILLFLSLLPTVYITTIIAKKYVKRAPAKFVRTMAAVLLMFSGVNILYKASTTLL